MSREIIRNIGRNWWSGTDICGLRRRWVWAHGRLFVEVERAYQVPTGYQLFTRRYRPGMSPALFGLD